MPPESLTCVVALPTTWRAPARVGVAESRRRRRITEIEVVAGAALVLYVVAALWLRYGMDYAIGDALARSAASKYVLFSRDAHLGAFGFAWMPLPTLLQLPFTLFLEPFGRAELAGPFSTAACMAGAVYVLGRLCRALGLTRPLAVAIMVAFGANPVVVFFAANGMSEASGFLFLAVAMLGYLGWIRERRLGALVLLSTGLAGAVLTRYEVLLLVPVLAGLAAWEGRGVRHWRDTALIVTLPSAFAFALWLGTNWLIMGSPMAWLDALSSSAPPPRNAAWLPPVDESPLSAVTYCIRWVIMLAPGLVLLLPALLLPIGRLGRAGLGIVAGAAVFPAVIALLLLRHNSYGNPRYFGFTTLFGAVATAWIATHGPTRRWARRTWHTTLVSCLALGAITGPVALSDPVATAVESEGRIFAALRGERRAQKPGTSIDEWRAVASFLDRELASGGRVLIDARFAFPAELLSRRPKQFVISSDRDYEPILADPVGKFEYLLTTAGLAGTAQDDGELLLNATGGKDTWTRIKSFDVAKVYKADWGEGTP